MSELPPPGFPFLHGASVALSSDAGDIHRNPVDDLSSSRKVTIALDVIKRCKAPNTKVPMKSLIYFVDQLEIQHQSIEYKDFLIENCHFIKHDSSPDDIFNALVKTHQEQEHSKFGKLDKQIIWDRVNNRISKVRDMYKESKLSEFRCWLKGCDISWDSPISKDLDVSGPFPGLNTSDRIREIQGLKCTLVHLGHFRCSRKVDDRWFPSSLFSELMIRTLKKNDYAMDLNPVSELEKIELSDPVSYAAHVIFPQPHKVASIDWSEMVRVDKISLDATQQDVQKLFSSCGYIQHFVMTSGDKYQTAFVYFTKIEAKKKALLLTDESINNQRIKVASITVYRPDWALDEDDDYDSGDDDDIIKSDDDDESKQVEAARSAESDVETGGDIATAAEVSTMLELLNKYWSCIRHPAKHERAATNVKDYNILYYYTHSLSKGESC